MKENKGKIIAITSTTGGVGKTITTLNLAGSYHLLGNKVLIIDFDLFGGDIALSLNLKCDKTVFNLVLDLSNKSAQPRFRKNTVFPIFKEVLPT